MIGVLYPAIKSIEALETKDTLGDDKQWLTYWTIYGIFILLDEFAGFILHYIPFYHFAKVCFLIWLFNPATLGAALIFKNVAKPAYLKYRKQIENGIELFD